MSVKAFVGLLLLLFILPIPANATVVYDPSYPRIVISDNTDAYNMPTLYSALVSQYNESYVQTNMLNETAPKIWLLKAFLVANVDFWINGSDTAELRVGNHYMGWGLYGLINIDNTKISSWNLSDDNYSSYRQGWSFQLYRSVTNAVFYSVGKVYFGFDYGMRIENLSFKNIIVEKATYGLTIQNANNVSVDNITIKNGDSVFGYGISESSMDNSIMSNINIINVSDYTQEANGAYGLAVNGDNNTYYNIYINSTAYSGTNILGNNVTLRNVYVGFSGHNGFEFQVHNSYAENITVAHSASNNFFSAVGSEDNVPRAQNNTLRNIVGVDTGGGYNVRMSELSNNVLIENADLTGDGVMVSESENVTVINLTQRNGYDSIYYTIAIPVEYNYNGNHKVIDSTQINNSYVDLQLLDTSNTRIINVNYTSYRLTGGDFQVDYYADAYIKDKNNFPVEYASLQFRNEINPSFSSSDGWGNDKSAFTTASDGHTALPNVDRANSPAIADYYINSSGTTYFNWTVSAYDPNNIWTNIAHTIYPNGTIQQQQPLAQVTDILPNASWYRINPDIPTNTISLQINYTKTSIMVNTSAETTITVNNFNASAAKGEILANFTSDTIDGNNVTFTANLKPYASYLIKRDNVNYTIVQADSTGKIIFTNSAW